MTLSVTSIGVYATDSFKDLLSSSRAAYLSLMTSVCANLAALVLVQYKTTVRTGMNMLNSITHGIFVITVNDVFDTFGVRP